MMQTNNLKRNNNKQGGFIELIVIVIIAMLLMRHFHLTISGILNYFNLTPNDVANAIKQIIAWIQNLVNSVK